jgi:glycosyltransferase involved in cell wall biosynthesis
VKITILWASLASYSVTFFRELKSFGCKIQLIYQPLDNDAPYENFDLSFCKEVFEDSPKIRKNIEHLCINFNPDCILMNSWSHPHYMRISRKLKAHGSYVVSVMDNQWNGTIKQWIGAITSRWFLKPSIDTFLVAGDRQAFFARKLGYDDVMYGCYAADTTHFRSKKPICKRDKNFLFVGRLSKSKGVDLLIDSYKEYRNSVEKPWGLKIVGTGSMTSMVDGITGIEYLGFIQPKKLPMIMESARCLILPSSFEPWGVVIHEASAAGLPIIATFLCGATTAFVRDGVNGYIIPPSLEKLTQAMRLISEIDDEALTAMSDISKGLASLWSPQLLSRYFCSNVQQRCKNRKAASE